MKNNGYIGKISHGGSQKVEAPNPGPKPKDTGKVKQGEDLGRTNGGK